MIGRNDLCWCGSGKKYKKCHLPTESGNTMPLGQVKQSLYKEFKKKECLYPQRYADECSKKIIAAHSIQKSRVLKSISNDSNEVMTFYQTTENKPRYVGWKQASTFNGFCEKHDKQIFSVIEDRDVEPTSEQLFIFGYRAFCHELYQKSASLRYQPYALENLLKGRSLIEQQKIYEIQKASNLGVKKGQEEINKVKEGVFDPVLKTKQYDCFSSLYIEFSGHPAFVATGVITPDFDVHGKKIQCVLQQLESSETAHHLALSLINLGDKVRLVLYWPSKFVKCTDFVMSLIELTEVELIRKLCAMVFGYLENVYFSDSWWNNLSPNQQKEIFRLSRSVFYTICSPSLSFSPVDWAISRCIKNI